MKIRTLILAGTVAILQGCGGVYSVSPLFNSTQLPTTESLRDFYTDTGQINVGGQAFEMLFTIAKTKEPRNALLTRLRLASDDLCNAHLSNMRATATNINLGFGTATSLFTGAAALSTGGTAQTLAAVGAFTSASQVRFSEEVYRNNFADALIRVIQAERATKRSKLDNGMSQESDLYPVEQGILDIREYHDACSFFNGMAVITAKASDTRPQTQSAIKQRIDSIKATAEKTNLLNTQSTQAVLNGLIQQMGTAPE